MRRYAHSDMAANGISIQFWVRGRDAVFNHP